MNSVKLLHIKCCFFQFFNSPVALKNKNKFWPPQEKVEMTPLAENHVHCFSSFNISHIMRLSMAFKLNISPKMPVKVL